MSRPCHAARYLIDELVKTLVPKKKPTPEVEEALDKHENEICDYVHTIDFLLMLHTLNADMLAPTDMGITPLHI